MTSIQFAAARNAPDGWDSDGSLSWEDFFGTSTDLVPTLLGMYDALVGRPEQAAAADVIAAVDPGPATPQRPSAMSDVGVVTRPLSVSSIASSSSSSSGASSCSGTAGGRLGGAPKSSAYLASIESLEDDSDDEQLPVPVSERERPKPGGRADRLKGSTGSQGSGDSGVGSPCSYISSPSPPQGRPRYCDPHLSYMDRVVMEILETEGVYVKDLQQVIEGYLNIWRASPDPSLEDHQLHDLFSNIEQIHQFNSGFLEQLEKCGLDPVQVARCFVKNNEGFTVYTQYCTNYPRTVSVLTELMRKEATVRLFRERQACLQHPLPLGSYLLKPVQRILKYHLLLQNLVKHYSCEAVGHSDIVEALSAMTGIAHHINNMKRKHEHSVRVQEIQSLLYGWEGEDLTTFGELCAEGAFRLSGAKAPRHAFLFDKMLLITKKKEEANLGYKAHIMCSNLMLIESVPGEPLSFHVIPFDNPRLQYTLQARNLEQKREWTLQLKRVILENYNAVIPSHARQLVMELGQNRTDDDVLAEKGTPKRQHSAPEYLEKRKQERDRRKSETGLRSRLRRSRKSDVGSSCSEGGHQRGRRASSSSHDRSLSRESPRSLSPIIAKVSLLIRTNRTHSNHHSEDRFGSWRRKSEPGCYSPNSSTKTPKPLQVHTASQHITSPEQDQIIPKDEENKHGSQPEFVHNIEDGFAPEPEQRTQDSLKNMVRDGKDEEEEAKTLEEIVGQLLMQNHEFQKILKKQQRCVGLRHRNIHREETTDTENDEEGVYETLSPTSVTGIRSSAGVTYRSHRHAHMRAQRNQQKTLTIASSLSRSQQRTVQNSENKDMDCDYVTLMCHIDESDKSLQHIVNSRLSSNVESNRHVLVKNEKSDAFGGQRGFTDNFRSASESRISHIWKQNREDNTTPISKASEKNEVEKVQPDGFGNYDNLQHIWESVKKQQEEFHKLAEKTEAGEDVEPLPSLSRRRSFSCRNGESMGVHNQHPSMSHSNLNYTNTPTSPAVWLKQQGQHLATPSKKSGSLPRSFQLSHDAEQKVNSLSRTKRVDRPFTIASDKPPEINFEDIERYIEQTNTCNIRHRFPLSGDTTEEDSMTEYTATPNASMNELNVHPEYKIYRPTVSRATLKHVISSVRLGGTRASSETLDEERERRASRLVYALARQYSKTLRQRIRNIMGDDSEDCDLNRTPSPVQMLPSPNLPIYKQGSSSLGARIAHSEYANPRLLYPNIQAQSTANLRPDSVLSVSSHFTSSSEGEKATSLDTSQTKPSEDLSDGSADSFYERSFEAIESMLENDAFRDSAVFSDHDECSDMTATVSSSLLDNNTNTQSKISRSKNGKVPPPIPAKPEALKKKIKNGIDDQQSVSITFKREHLVHGLEGICKSICERRRELEQWKGSKAEEEGDTSSQHSTASTVIEVGADDEGGTPKGWVKHVVGKLQGEPGDAEDATKCQ